VSDESFISIRSVSKHFGPVKAVEEVELDIRRGEFFTLLGPSGCGKTTLLRMLAGFEAPTFGEIYIDEQPMSAIPPNHRPVNMVFQNYAIFPHLDVRGNIAYGMRKSGLSKAALDAKIEEMLELIRLPGYGPRGANELSGGERQRVALARALIKRPKVLLLDEPLGALDKKLREHMQIELRSLQRQVGITFVFVTHDQEEALTMSDRIAVMSQGRAVEVNSPSRLYESPRTRFVADFIGTMNFFPGSVRHVEDGAVTVDTEGLGEVRALPQEAGAEPGSEVVVAIRPEKLSLSTEKPDEACNVAQGRMGAFAYLGDRSHFLVHLPGREEPVSVALQNLMRSLTPLHEPDQPIWITWPEDSVVLLPPGTARERGPDQESAEERASA